MVTIQLNNKVFYLLLTILLIITISLTVFALTPLNGHDVSQIDFNSQIPSLSVSGTAELGILRLADTGTNNISWDIQEESNNDLTFKYMMEKVRITAMGDVGIGTIPSAKLHVDGNIKANNIGASQFVREQIVATHDVKYTGVGQSTRKSKNCSAGTTLVNWGVAKHNAGTNDRYSYCNCLNDTNNNRVTASYLDDQPTNKNFVCACFLLCHKN
jgi:hypothetical protein